MITKATNIKKFHQLPIEVHTRQACFMYIYIVHLSFVDSYNTSYPGMGLSNLSAASSAVLLSNFEVGYWWWLGGETGRTGGRRNTSGRTWLKFWVNIGILWDTYNPKWEA